MIVFFLRFYPSIFYLLGVGLCGFSMYSAFGLMKIMGFKKLEVNIFFFFAYFFFLISSFDINSF